MGLDELRQNTVLAGKRCVNGFAPDLHMADQPILIIAYVEMRRQNGYSQMLEQLRSVN